MDKECAEKRKEREIIIKEIIALRKVEKGQDHDEALRILEGSLRALTEQENGSQSQKSGAVFGQWGEAYALFLSSVSGT